MAHEKTDAARLDVNPLRTRKRLDDQRFAKPCPLEALTNRKTPRTLGTRRGSFLRR